MCRKLMIFVACFMVVMMGMSVVSAEILYENDFSSDDSLADWIGMWDGSTIENGWLRMQMESMYAARFLMYDKSLSGSIAVEADYTVDGIAAPRDAFGFAIYRRAPQHGLGDSGYFVMFHTFNPAANGDRWQVVTYKPDGAGSIKLVGDVVRMDTSYVVGGELPWTHFKVELVVEEARNVIRVYADGNMIYQIQDEDQDIPRYYRGYIGLYKENTSIGKWDNFRVSSL